MSNRLTLLELTPEELCDQIDELVSEGTKPDDILECFRDDVLNQAYLPMDLAKKLLQINCSKHKVFELIIPYFKLILDTPDFLIHEAAELQKAGIDRYRIMFWLEKWMDATEFLEYSEELKQFGVELDFHIADCLKQYGIEV